MFLNLLYLMEGLSWTVPQFSGATLKWHHTLVAPQISVVTV